MIMAKDGQTLAFSMQKGAPAGKKSDDYVIKKPNQMANPISPGGRGT